MEGAKAKGRGRKGRSEDERKASGQVGRKEGMKGTMGY